MAAGDAPLLPENEALLLAAGDAPLLSENEALLLAAGDAPRCCLRTRRCCWPASRPPTSTLRRCPSPTSSSTGVSHRGESRFSVSVTLTLTLTFTLERGLINRFRDKKA